VALLGRGTSTAQQTVSTPTPTRPREDEPGPAFLLAAYVVLLLFGMVLGLLGVFLLLAGPRIGDTLVLPVGLVIAVVGHPLAAFLGLRTAGTRAGTLTPLIGWSVVVLPLSSGTAEGDIALPSSFLSISYLLVGVLAFGVASFLSRPTRGPSSLGRR
jgi:hypothetical protein